MTKKQMKAGRRYTPDFKERLIKLLTDDTHWNIKEVADFMKVPTGTIYRWLRENK